MVRWTELYSHFLGDQQAEVELMAMMWRVAALRADPTLNSNLVANQYNVYGMALQLDDYAGVTPDESALEWARARDGYPPPVPFFIVR